MQVKDGFLLRQVAEDYAIVPIGEEVLEFSGILTCNETGAFLWKQLESDRTPEQLVDALLAEYEVSRTQAVVDVERFIEMLRASALLRSDASAPMSVPADEPR